MRLRARPTLAFRMARKTKRIAAWQHDASLFVPHRDDGDVPVDSWITSRRRPCEGAHDEPHALKSDRRDVESGSGKRRIGATPRLHYASPIFRRRRNGAVQLSMLVT